LIKFVTLILRGTISKSNPKADKDQKQEKYLNYL